MTYTGNGWHPHVHWLDFWEQVLGPDVIAEYRAVFFRAWSRAVGRGDRNASWDRGVVLLPVMDGDSLGTYVTEMSVTGASYELTTISTKEARKSGLTPFQILAKVYGPGSHPWVDLWWEYEQSTKGRRMLGTSRGMLDALGLREEDPEPREAGEVVAFVRAEDWSAIRWFTAAGLSGAQEILEDAAAGGQIAVDRAVRVLLGGGAPVVELVEVGDVQLVLGPGDDGGMF
jgi:hypothetical protein